MIKTSCKLFCIFLMFFVFSANVCFSVEEGRSATVETEEFDFANGLFARGMYDMSIKGYQEFLERYPDSQYAEIAVFRVAECYFLSKQYDKALSDYKAFMKKYPSSELRYTAELRIAQISLAEKEYKNAEKILLRLVATQPSPEVAAASEYYLGIVYFEGKQYDKAKKIFQEVLKKEADANYLTFSCISLGEIYLEEGDDEAASSAFAAAVKFADSKALKERMALRAAEVYSGLGDYESAKKFYKTVIDEPGDPQVFDAAVIGYLSSLHANKEFEVLIEQALDLLSRANNDNTKAQLLFIIGNRYFNSDDYREAEKAYSEALRLYPDTEFGLLAHLNDCWALYRLKQYEDCLARIESYGEKSGNRKDEALYIKGKVYADMGEMDKALDAFVELEKSFPQSDFLKETIHQKAWIYEKKGEKDNAVKTYLLFAKSYPDDQRSPTMLLKSAQVNYQLQKYDEAIQGYKSFLEKYPENALGERAKYQLGNIYLEKGLTQQGVKILEDFLEEFKLSEATNYVLFSLGRAYQGLDEWDKAIEKYRVIVNDKNAGNDKKLYVNSLESIAFCYFKKGNKEKAAEEYFKLISPANEFDVPEGVFLWVADYYLNIKDNNKSISVLEALKERYPASEKTGDVAYLFGQNYIEQNKLDEAIQHFDQAIKAGASSPYLERSYLGLGQALYKKGEYDKALASLEEALDKHKDDKTSAYVRFEIGNVYYKKGSFSEAAKQYLMVAILYDEKDLCSMALFQAGVSFKEAGKEKESTEAFNELIERYPDTTAAEKAKKYLGQEF